MQNSFDVLHLSTENALIGINPQGGYVSSWQLKNPKTNQLEHLLYQGSVQKRTGIPVLFPYFGKAENKKQHGFGRDCEWQVIKEESQKVVMSLRSDQISAEAKSEYPYQFEAEIGIELENDGSLLYSLFVKNTGTVALPLCPGLHPYWAVSQEDKTKVTIEGITGFDAAAIDWAKNPPDIVYTYLGKTTLHLPNKNISIQDVTEGQKALKHIVVWSQNIDQPDFNFICVEPVCGDNFDIDRNPTWVEPGSEWKMKVKFECVLNSN